MRGSAWKENNEERKQERESKNNHTYFLIIGRVRY